MRGNSPLFLEHCKEISDDTRLQSAPPCVDQPYNILFRRVDHECLAVGHANCESEAGTIGDERIPFLGSLNPLFGVEDAVPMHLTGPAVRGAPIFVPALSSVK